MDVLYGRQHRLTQLGTKPSLSATAANWSTFEFPTSPNEKYFSHDFMLYLLGFRRYYRKNSSYFSWKRHDWTDWLECLYAFLNGVRLKLRTGFDGRTKDFKKGLMWFFDKSQEVGINMSFVFDFLFLDLFWFCIINTGFIYLQAIIEYRYTFYHMDCMNLFNFTIILIWSSASRLSYFEFFYI